jgi:ABC-type Fe3+-hydroxamate transport system substrate-binding protein
MTIKNGDIISLETKDSYHLDMPSVGKWQLEPPAPIKKHLGVENWYLRDSNWSPDWPSAARQIEKIYKGESRAIGLPEPNFSALIAINPDFIADLLRLVGPITIDNETYYPENFQPLLQYNVEVAYKDKDISSWDRNNIINDLVG